MPVFAGIYKGQSWKRDWPLPTWEGALKLQLIEQMRCLFKFLAQRLVRFGGRSQTIPSALKEFVASPATGSRPAIETEIEGDFNGWDGETIFKLANDQIWQQAEYDYEYEHALPS